MSIPRPQTVDEYINRAPEIAQAHLIEIRNTLKLIAPKAEELIKWGMPVFKGKRIYFAYCAYKKHLNFIPTATSFIPFKTKLEAFNTKKDSIQFPYNQPLPLDLITKIAQFRIKEVEINDAKWIQ